MIAFINNQTATAADFQIGTNVTIQLHEPVTLTVDEHTVAIIFDLDGSVLDFAENFETAISYVNNELCLALAVQPDNGRELEDMQLILDNEALLRADCFGYRIPGMEQFA